MPMQIKSIVSMCVLTALVAGCTPKGDDAAPEVLTAFRTADGKWGFQKGGKTVVEAKFDNVQPFKNGVARIKVNDKFGYIDESGKTLIEPKYEEAGRFSEGMAPVKLDDKFGFVDRTGKVVLEAKYDRADEFGGGYAIVEMDGKQGYIDKEGVFKEGEAPGSGESEGNLDMGEETDNEGGN